MSETPTGDLDDVFAPLHLLRPATPAVRAGRQADPSDAGGAERAAAPGRGPAPYRRRDATRDSLTPRQADHLRSTGLLVAPHRGVLVPAGMAPDPVVEAAAAVLAGPTGAVVACGLALRLHGVPADLTPPGCCVIAPGPSIRPDLTVHQRRPAERDIVTVEGLPTTGLALSALHAALHLKRWPAVVLLDAVLQRGLTRLDLEACLLRLKGVRGVEQLRLLVAEADEGAQSPQETRMRLLITDAGLPRPETQVEVFQDGRLIAAGDLGYREHRRLFDYDGFEAHRKRPAFRHDRRRDRRVRRGGWEIDRYTDEDLHSGPGGIVADVRELFGRQRPGADDHGLLARHAVGAPARRARTP